MATSALPLIGITVLALTACDLSQKKPETIKASLQAEARVVTAPPAAASPAPPAPALIQAPRAGAGSSAGTENTAGERSIRLYGPGVSRKRQIRV